jgi:hypothetical protein
MKQMYFFGSIVSLLLLANPGFGAASLSVTNTNSISTEKPATAAEESVKAEWSELSRKEKRAKKKEIKKRRYIKCNADVMLKVTTVAST